MNIQSAQRWLSFLFASRQSSGDGGFSCQSQAVMRTSADNEQSPIDFSRSSLKPTLIPTNGDGEIGLKYRLTSGLLVAVVILFFVAVNLPYQYVEVEQIWLGQLDFPASQEGGQVEMPVMGGWPLRYVVGYPTESEVVYRLWEPLLLGVNLLFGLLVCWFVYWFLSFRHRSLYHEKESGRRRIWFDSFFAFCILAIPTGIVAVKAWTPYQQKKIAAQLSRNGNFFVSAWVPEIIESQLPQSLKRWLLEVRQIRLTGATPEILRRVVEIPTLVALHSYGGKHDPDTFKALGKSLHFNSLLISNGSLSDDEVSVIARLPWLKHLKLAGTPLTAEQFHQFDQLPLMTVDLQATGIAYEEIEGVDWAKTCELLWLSRPPNGVSNSISFEDWTRLRTLWVKRRTYELNEAVLGLHFYNLPQLQRLCLDRVQKHDLSFVKVPRLASVEEEIVDARFVLNDNYLVPGLTWVRNLTVDGADSLNEIGCYAKDLEQLRLGDSPNLKKLRLGAYLVTLTGNVIPQQTDPEKCRRWIRYLGERRGPYELDLGYLPLKGIDLTPLSQNVEIQQLNLNGTYVDFSQVKQIGSMSQYNSLDARTTLLRGQDFEELLEQFPEMDRLLINGEQIHSLDTRDRDRLKYLGVSTMREIEKVSLLNQPRMRTSLTMIASPKVLHIENVPGLEGLSLEGPWPVSATLSGLRDLEWFAGGGTELTDEIAGEVLKCSHLHRLTFAYPSISRGTLSGIGKLKELISLALPGTLVDDEMVRSWRNVHDLWEANFDDTSVSAETIIWLTRMQSLRRLSLNRIGLDESTVQAIVALRQICELHLENTPLPPEALSTLLQYGHLEVLNVTGWDFSEALLSVLEKDAKRLNHLIVRDRDLSLELFRRSMDLSDQIYVDVSVLPEGLTNEEVTSIHERADAVRRLSNSGWRLMLEAPQDTGSGMSRDEFRADRSRRLNGRQRPWMPEFFLVNLKPEKFVKPPSQ